MSLETYYQQYSHFVSESTHQGRPGKNGNAVFK